MALKKLLTKPFKGLARKITKKANKTYDQEDPNPPLFRAAPIQAPSTKTRKSEREATDDWFNVPPRSNFPIHLVTQDSVQTWGSRVPKARDAPTSPNLSTASAEIETAQILSPVAGLSQEAVLETTQTSPLPEISNCEAVSNILNEVPMLPSRTLSTQADPDESSPCDISRQVSSGEQPTEPSRRSNPGTDETVHNEGLRCKDDSHSEESRDSAVDAGVKADTASVKPAMARGSPEHGYTDDYFKWSVNNPPPSPRTCSNDSTRCGTSFQPSEPHHTALPLLESTTEQLSEGKVQEIADYQNLDSDYQELVGSYNALSTSHNQLDVDFAAQKEELRNAKGRSAFFETGLNQSYEAHQSTYQELQKVRSEFASLQLAYAQEASRLISLQDQHASLAQDYLSLRDHTENIQNAEKSQANLIESLKGEKATLIRDLDTLQSEKQFEADNATRWKTKLEKADDENEELEGRNAELEGMFEAMLDGEDPDIASIGSTKAELHGYRARITELENELVYTQHQRDTYKARMQTSPAADKQLLHIERDYSSALERERDNLKQGIDQQETRIRELDQTIVNILIDQRQRNDAISRKDSECEGIRADTESDVSDGTFDTDTTSENDEQLEDDTETNSNKVSETERVIADLQERIKRITKQNNKIHDLAMREEQEHNHAKTENKLLNNLTVSLLPCRQDSVKPDMQITSFLIYDKHNDNLPTTCQHAKDLFRHLEQSHIREQEGDERTLSAKTSLQVQHAWAKEAEQAEQILYLTQRVDVLTTTTDQLALQVRYEAYDTHAALAERQVQERLDYMQRQVEGARITINSQAACIFKLSEDIGYSNGMVYKLEDTLVGFRINNARLLAQVDAYEQRFFKDLLREPLVIELKEYEEDFTEEELGILRCINERMYRIAGMEVTKGKFADFMME